MKSLVDHQYPSSTRDGFQSWLRPNIPAPNTVGCTVAERATDLPSGTGEHASSRGRIAMDPPGQRGMEWTQLGPSKWLEVCQSGQRNTFTVTNRSATVAGNHGQIVERG